MPQKFKKLLIFFIALFFSFWVIIFLPYYAHISELDDVSGAGLIVIPAFIISVGLCLILIKNKSWILSLIIILFNSLNAVLAISLTHEAIIEILSLTNKIYDGKSEYTSFHIFTIGIIPAVLVLINWVVLFFNLQIIKKHERIQGTNFNG